MRNTITALLLTALAVGCSSSGGGKKGATGPHSAYHWDHHVGVGTRAGYDSAAINRYRLEIDYRAGTTPAGNGWMHTDCGCLAYNARKGPFKHRHVYYGPPGDPDARPVDAWLAAHETLHEYVESNPEHGGNPLPAEFRRGGSFDHPREIYVQGKWRRCQRLVQGRWPALFNPRRESSWLVHRDREPFSCDAGPGANNWHD